MKFASDLPGYAQGHRFSQAPEFYDPVNQRFNDLAGYNRFGMYVKKTVGTPVFHARGTNAREGLYMDNTNQWSFPYACPWHGSGLVVLEMESPAVNAAKMYPYIFGTSIKANITNDPLIYFELYFGQRTLYVWGAAGDAVSVVPAAPNSTIMVLAWSRNQQDRKYRFTRDGTTITAAGPFDAASTNGNGLAMLGQAAVRLGNLDADKTSSAASTTGTMHVFEQHFWKGDVLKDNPAELKAFIDTLKGHYGIV